MRFLRAWIEVREAQDDLLGVDGAHQGGNTLDDLLGVELLGGAAALHLRIDEGLRLGVNGVAVQQSLGMHANGVVDHELRRAIPMPSLGSCPKVKADSGLPTFL